MVVMSASRCSCAKQKITNRVHARKVFNGMSLRRRLLFFACVSAVAVRAAAQMHPREFTTTVVARAPGVGLAGAAQVDLDVAGTWVGFAPPVSSGNMQLHSVTAELQGVAEALLISSAA